MLSKKIRVFFSLFSFLLGIAGLPVILAKEETKICMKQIWYPVQSDVREN